MEINILHEFRDNLINGDSALFSAEISGISIDDVVELQITIADSLVQTYRVTRADADGIHRFAKTYKYIGNAIYNDALEIVKDLVVLKEYEFRYKFINITSGGEFSGFSKFEITDTTPANVADDSVSFATYSPIESSEFNRRFSDLAEEKAVESLEYEIGLVAGRTSFRLKSGAIIDHRGIRLDLALAYNKEVVLNTENPLMRIAVSYKKEPRAYNKDAYIIGYAIPNINSPIGKTGYKDNTHCELFLLQYTNGAWNILYEIPKIIHYDSSIQESIDNQILNLDNKYNKVQNEVNDIFNSLSIVDQRLDDLDSLTSEQGELIIELREDLEGTKERVTILERDLLNLDGEFEDFKIITNEAIRNIHITIDSLEVDLNNKLSNLENKVDQNKEVFEQFVIKNDADLAGKSPIGHKHPISDVIDLQSNLNLKAPLNSPALTGTPTAPTATKGANTTQLATTAFVTRAVKDFQDEVLGGASAAFDTLKEIEDYVLEHQDEYSALLTVVNGKYNKPSTGIPKSDLELGVQGSLNKADTALQPSGTAAAATKLATARNFSITGAVTAPVVSFDGTGNVVLNTTLTAHTHAISDVTNLQTTLDGKAALSHTHEISEVNGLQVALNGKAASSHTHTIAQITNLQTTLDGKAASSHTHPLSQVIGLEDALATKAPLVSPALTGTPTAPTAVAGTNTTQLATTAFVTQAVGNKTTITGNAGSATKLATARNFSITGAVTAPVVSFNGTGNVVLNTTLTAHTHAISDVTNLQTTLDGKAALSHTHEISEINGLQAALNGKAASSHTHTIAQITNLQTTLDGKAASSHTHSLSQIIGLENALATKAPLVSPALTGIPTAPTAAAGANTTQLATTAFVTQAVGNKTTITGNAGSATKLATARNFSITGAVTAPVVSFDGTGNVILNTTLAAHTHAISNVTNLQTTLDSKAPLASPVLTGTPTAPTAVSGSNNTQIATTAFVTQAVNTKAPLEHTHNKIIVEDIRDTNPTPNDAENNSITSFFSNTYGDTWRSGITIAGWNDGYNVWQLSNPASTSAVESLKFRAGLGTSWLPWRTIWHDGNDGTGSGLDADLLDGRHASSFADASHTHAIANITNLQTTLDGKAASSHTHTIANITNLQTTLDDKTPRVTLKRRTSKDTNGVYRVVNEYLEDGTLYSKSTLSGGTSPKYTTRTINFYNSAGSIIKTVTSTITYDGDEWLNEI